MASFCRHSHWCGDGGNSEGCATVELHCILNHNARGATERERGRKRERKKKKGTKKNILVFRVKNCFFFCFCFHLNYINAHTKEIFIVLNAQQQQCRSKKIKKNKRKSIKKKKKNNTFSAEWRKVNTKLRKLLLIFKAN